MLHMAILRSPYAHARIVSIDTSDGAGARRAWPPSSPARTSPRTGSPGCRRSPTTPRPCSPTDKVRFQGQEVAAVIATERVHRPDDALELIDVDYEPLPPVVDPRKAMDPDAPLIRDDKEGQTDNRCYHWEAGEKEATDRAFAEADTVVTRDTHYPRCHPAPLETCGMRRRLEPGDRPADHLHDLPSPARPPHGVRARRRAAGGQDPDHLAGHRRRLRQQGPGLSGLRRRHRRLAADRPARSSGSRTAPRT